MTRGAVVISFGHRSKGRGQTDNCLKAQGNLGARVLEHSLQLASCSAAPVGVAYES
jgi:hypothetical protein